MADPALEREAIALFEEIYALPEAEREAALQARAASRPELASRLAALLAAHAANELQTGGVAQFAEEVAPPERLGSYRLGERIGRGGMGAVYRATRLTGDFDHTVAIKIIRPGPGSDQLVERFHGERRLLARLVHPNIAQLYDGGETADGAPYFVMEHVDGVPLGRWIDETAPSLGERARIFGEVCTAVAFAHRNLVIHRDLTPSNVLVTPDGVAKLIDFGIARPPDEGKPARERSSLGSLSLTPGFAAPERIESGAVSTASDIYSLGKLAERLFAECSGDHDLQAIIAKAVATDPGERYQTVDALADDIRAWRADMPVTAVEGGQGYVLRKFVSRNRALVTAAAAALVLIVSALVITLAAYSQAQAARKAEEVRFAELRNLASYMLFDLEPRMEKVAGNTAARAELAKRAQTYLSALADSAHADPELRLEAARGFNRLAQIQGLPTEPNLGQLKEARDSLARAHNLLASLPLKSPERAVEESRTLTYRAMIELHGDGNQDAAAKSLGMAVTSLDGVPTSRRSFEWSRALANARHARAELLLLSGQVAELFPLANLIERGPSSWPASARDSSAEEFELAYADFVRGQALTVSGREAEALPVLRKAERRLKNLDSRSPNDPVILNALAWLAYVGYGAGSTADLAESARYLALARATVDRLLALEADDRSLQSLAVNVRQSQAEQLAQNGKFAPAIALQREVLAGRHKAAERDRDVRALSRLAMSQLILGNIALQSGDRGLACASYQDAEKAFRGGRRAGPLLGRSEEYASNVSKNLASCRARSKLAPII